MKNKKKTIVAIFAVLLVILAVIVLLLLVNINKAKEYKDKLSLGKKYLAELDYENAEIIYEEAIRIDEKRPQAYVQLSNVYVAQDRYEDAWDTLERAEANVTKADWLEGIQEQKEVVEEAKTRYEEISVPASPAENVEEVTEPVPDSDEAFDLDYNVAAKNGWAYVKETSAMYVYKADSDEVIAKIDGSMDGALMAVDDGVYYGRDRKLEFYSHITGEITVVYQDNLYVNPIGITGNYLYFEVRGGADDDERDVYQMTLSDGSLKQMNLYGYCMHSDTAFCGERFFYTEGVADVGTTSLCEVNPETGESTVLVANTGAAILAKGDVLYYVETDRAGDSTQVNASIKSWDTVTGEQNSLRSGIGRDVGAVCAVTDQAVYASPSNLYRIVNGTVESLQGYYCAQDGNRLFSCEYETQNVFCYDETTGTTTVVETLNSEEYEYVAGAADGYLYIFSQDGHRRVKISE